VAGTPTPESKGLTARELAPEERDLWGEFVRASPSGSAYSLPEYLEALAGAAGGRVLVLAVFRGDTIAGGVAIYEQHSPVGSFVAPRLLLYYNGLVLREYETRYPSERLARQVEVIDALAAACETRGYGRLELRSRNAVFDARPLLARGWAVEPSYSYVVPIEDLESQWQRVDQNLRRLIERGRKQELSLVVDEDFDSFFDLHEATHDRKGAPIYLEREAFRRYYTHLRERELCHLFHACLPDGRIAASQLVLVGHHVTHTVCAGTAAEFQNLGSSPFLRWHVFEWLAARGYAGNDLTDATLGSVSRFKSQLGAELTLSLVASRPRSAGHRAHEAAYRVGGAIRGLAARRRS
jgi:hypothetical protein